MIVGVDCHYPDIRGSASYVWLDESCSLSFRSKTLERFRTDAATTILLMTIGTEAVGCVLLSNNIVTVLPNNPLYCRRNLTVATYVHILEPQ